MENMDKDMLWATLMNRRATSLLMMAIRTGQYNHQVKVLRNRAILHCLNDKDNYINSYSSHLETKGQDLILEGVREFYADTFRLITEMHTKPERKDQIKYRGFICRYNYHTIPMLQKYVGDTNGHIFHHSLFNCWFGGEYIYFGTPDKYPRLEWYV